MVDGDLNANSSRSASRAIKPATRWVQIRWWSGRAIMAPSGQASWPRLFESPGLAHGAALPPVSNGARFLFADQMSFLSRVTINTTLDTLVFSVAPFREFDSPPSFNTLYPPALGRGSSRPFLHAASPTRGERPHLLDLLDLLGMRRTYETKLQYGNQKQDADR